MRRFADRFQYVQCADGIDLEVFDRIVETGGDRDLCGEMKDFRRPADGVGDGARVSCIGIAELHQLAVYVAQPFQIALHAAAGEIVEETDALSIAEKPVGDIRADEAAAAGDQDEITVHTVSPLADSSAAACCTRSTAICPSSHCASWSRPSSKSTFGSYPRKSRVREMSAKQCRMTPTRYLPVISGSTCAFPSTSASLRATSRTVKLRPLPTMKTWPATSGALSS